MLRLSNSFERLSDANLQVEASSIISSLTNNANFPEPKPELGLIRQALDVFGDALAAAQDGARSDIAFKNQKREELLELLRRLGDYVVFTSAGDTVKAATSGYTFAHEYGGQQQPVGRPENLVLSDGPNVGELHLEFKRVVGARGYVYEYTPDPLSENSVWRTQTGTVSQAIFSGLERGRKYWCRAGAISNHPTVYSDPISRIVQ